MPNITSCPNCGQLYEAASEEAANEPLYGDYPPKGRWCPVCFNHPVEASMRRRDRQRREEADHYAALRRAEEIQDAAAASEGAKSNP